MTLAPLLALALVTASPAVERDACAELRPAFRLAGWISGLPAETIEGMAWTETRCTSRRGTRRPVAGVLQVSWRQWGRLLTAAGYREQDLDDPGRGVVAGGLVLLALRLSYQRPTDDLLLCLYAVGPKALRFKQDCRYSRRRWPGSRRAGGGRRRWRADETSDPHRGFLRPPGEHGRWQRGRGSDRSPLR